jgi:hypothetical protein
MSATPRVCSLHRFCKLASAREDHVPISGEAFHLQYHRGRPKQEPQTLSHDLPQATVPPLFTAVALTRVI